MPSWARSWPWLTASPPLGATRAATAVLSVCCAAGAGVRSASPSDGLAPRCREKLTAVAAWRSTSVRCCRPSLAEAETTAGTTGPDTGPTGPRTPLITHDTPARTGAEQATRASAATPMPRSVRGPRRPAGSPPFLPPRLKRLLPLDPGQSSMSSLPGPFTSRGMSSPAVAPASSRPTAAISMATPGQAGTADCPLPGVTTTRLTATAKSSPARAMLQPAIISARRLLNSSAASAATAIPAVTQTRGRPGPPGLSSSKDRADRSCTARPGCCRPTSSSSVAGFVATWTVHGSSSTGGTAATMPRFRHMPGRAATRASAATRATTQISGTNAAATAIVRPVAQAARRARLGGKVSIRPPSRAIAGISTKTTAVPIRPAAIAPIATGSSAYEAAAQTRTSVERVTRRTARKAEIPASGTLPSRITSTASHGLPPSTVASAAITARYGGALLPEPTPTGWNPWRYSCQSPDAPPQAGMSAPPPSGPGASSDRSATRDITVRAMKSSTPGWVRMRCTRPVSVSRKSASSGSSVA